MDTHKSSKGGRNTGAPVDTHGAPSGPLVQNSKLATKSNLRTKSSQFYPLSSSTICLLSVSLFRSTATSGKKKKAARLGSKFVAAPGIWPEGAAAVEARQEICGLHLPEAGKGFLTRACIPLGCWIVRTDKMCLQTRSRGGGGVWKTMFL